MAEQFLLGSSSGDPPLSFISYISGFRLLGHLQTPSFHSQTNLVSAIPANMTGDPSVSRPPSPHEITVRLSDLSIEELTLLSTGSQTRRVKLVLLQPLADAKMRAACRNPASRFLQMMDGSQGRPTNDEILNIQPLNAAWRQAITKATPPRDVIFDLTLPKGNTSTSGFERVYWSSALPREGGLAVHFRDVMILAVTLATNIRMRVAGNLKFSIIADESEGIRPESVRKLNMQLLALARFKRRALGRDRDNAEDSSAGPEA